MRERVRESERKKVRESESERECEKESERKRERERERERMYRIYRIIMQTVFLPPSPVLTVAMNVRRADTAGTKKAARNATLTRRAPATVR